MGRKYIQFSTDNGNLVYRNTGRIYEKSYEIKGKTVYHDGRKIGMIGKPTKQQAQKIQTAKTNRLKKAQKLVKDYSKAKKSGSIDNIKIPNYKDLAEIRATMPILKKIDQFSKLQIEMYNFATRLNHLVNAGKITNDEANAWMDKWVKSKTKEDRTNLWKQLKTYEKDLGYEYNAFDTYIAYPVIA